MEVGPKIDTQEATAQPDLLEAFANKEVTIFGMTGTFKELESLCPLPPGDPRFTLQAKNEFVVKVANEAGLEIEPQYESLFSQITEQQGLERKFSVVVEATRVRDNPVELIAVRESPAKSETARPRGSRGFYYITPQLEEKKPETVSLASKRKVGQQQTRDAGKVALSKTIKKRQTNQVLSKKVSTIKSMSKPVPMTPPIYETKPVEIVAEAIQPASIPIESDSDPFVLSADTPIQAADMHQDVEAVQYGIILDEIKSQNLPPKTKNKTDANAKVLTNETWSVPLSATIAKAKVSFDLPNVWPDQTEGESNVMFEDILPELPAAYYDYAMPMGDEAPEPLELEYMVKTDDEEALPLDLVWANELSKEPIELYNVFVESLEELDEAQELPPIIAIIGDKMMVMELEQREEVAPIIKDIVGAIHGIHVLEENGFDPETMIAAEAQLEELCVALFESLGIDYDEQAVKQFANILLRPDFSLSPQPRHEEQAATVDLEYMGTREPKHFKRLSNRLSGKATHFEHVLGMFVLLCIRAARNTSAASLSAA